MIHPQGFAQVREAELLPCPFCGSVMISHWRANAYGSLERMAAPVCACGAQGPMYPTKAESVAAWNTRATPADPLKAEAEVTEEMVVCSRHPWIRRAAAPTA